MPALEPRCAIDVSQLPRWPMVSFSLSWADAGEAAESSVAAANATASWWIRVIKGLPSRRGNQSSRLGTLSGRAAMRNRALYRRVKASRAQADGVYVNGKCWEFQSMAERKHVKLFRHGRPGDPRSLRVSAARQ